MRLTSPPRSNLLSLTLTSILASACTIPPELPPPEPHLEVHPPDLSSDVGGVPIIELRFESPPGLSTDEEIISLFNRSIALFDEQGQRLELAPVKDLTRDQNGLFSVQIQPLLQMSSEWHTLSSSEELRSYFRFTTSPEASSGTLRVRIHPESAPVPVIAFVVNEKQTILKLQFSEPVGPPVGHSMKSLIRVMTSTGGLIPCFALNDGDGDAEVVPRTTWYLECESAPSIMHVTGEADIVSADGVPVRLFGSEEPGFSIALDSSVIGTPMWKQH